ncbi:MAG: hypothetical protein E7571_02485 [Ruminococcaceae bacterium]|nr:hypothetical protein [Oscillospiraceae bacterium]
MTYSQALEYMTNKQSLGIKPGLSRIKDLLKKMSYPQNKYKIIHVAGTNGKGTVASTIAKALADAGYKTGLFTSPWVLDYREQIQINGEFISKDTFASLVDSWSENDCTEFEFLTAIMYKYFADSSVDYAVVECGMGGKGDCTNVEEKNISVITSISLDHTNFLGNTVEEIAEEKSGILRENSVCFLYNAELRNHFDNKCKKLITGEINDNLCLVNAVLSELGIGNVTELVNLPARQEIRNGILLDGGHNFAAARMLEAKISGETAVIGMMKDKDVEAYLSLIAPKCSKIIAVTPDNSRSMSAKELSEIAQKYCRNVTVCNNTSEVLKYQPTLICGSFYLIREIINLI